MYNTNLSETNNQQQFAVTYLHNYSVHTHGTWIHCYNWMKKFGIHRFRIRPIVYHNGKPYYEQKIGKLTPLELFLVDPDSLNDGEDPGYNFTDLPGC